MTRSSRLTGLAADLAEALGEDGLAVLVQHRGGARLSVPYHPRPGSRLARELGPIYPRLQATFAGETFDVPLTSPAVADVSDSAILSEIAAGRSADDIAPRYRITRRRVFRILARARRPA